MNRYIVGTGDHVYQVVRPFGKLPKGMTFGNTSHVATDSRDQVYVFQRQDPPILVFDTNGSLLTTWGDGQLLDAHGIYISSDDEIFLVDRDAHEVVKFSTESRVLLRIGTREMPSLHGPFNHPADIAVAPGGEIFVADGYGNSRVHRFSAEGKHLNSWGSPGAGPGEFTTPHGIWVDPQERVGMLHIFRTRWKVTVVCAPSRTKAALASGLEPMCRSPRNFYPVRTGHILMTLGSWACSGLPLWG